MSDKPLAGQVALVTGASSGIGEGTALALGAAGATVVVAARRADRLAGLAGRIAAAGGTAAALTLDVTDEAQIAHAAETIRTRYGRLDCLVNSAGVMLSAKVADATLSDWRAMIESNLVGTMFVTHAMLPFMKAQRSGHIFNISSVGARLMNVGSPCYSAVKAGVNAFSESLRKEVAKEGIRITVVSPGIVATELFDHVRDPATRERFGNMLKGMTPLTPADIGNAIAYAFAQPPHVSINELLIRPTEQPE